jgi:SAM-dependent methyltransferase
VTRFPKFADNRRPGSLANKFRQRRMELFLDLVRMLPAPVRVLDVGGTEGYWQQMGLLGRPGLQVVLLNLHRESAEAPNVSAAVGDARDLSEFPDGSFDVVFSNSVIEHLGSPEDQARMASEVRRVGRRYFVQTPNRYFPLEPHFMFPGFQFLPERVRVGLVRRFALGYHERMRDPERARAAVAEIRLLSPREMRALFPEAELYRERVLGLTKSVIAYGGWQP